MYVPTLYRKDTLRRNEPLRKTFISYPSNKLVSRVFLDAAEARFNIRYAWRTLTKLYPRVFFSVISCRPALEELWTFDA